MYLENVVFDATVGSVLPGVPEPTVEPPRLHLDLRGAEDQPHVVERLLALGASLADIGQGTCRGWSSPIRKETRSASEDRTEYAAAGTLPALPLDVADPVPPRDFWAWLTGWVPIEEAGLLSLQHPSRRGPLLELCQEARPKESRKNRMHLDIRLEPGDDADAVASEIAHRGGHELHPN